MSTPRDQFAQLVRRFKEREAIQLKRKQSLARLAQSKKRADKVLRDSPGDEDWDGAEGLEELGEALRKALNLGERIKLVPASNLGELPGLCDKLLQDCDRIDEEATRLRLALREHQGRWTVFDSAKNALSQSAAREMDELLDEFSGASQKVRDHLTNIMSKCQISWRDVEDCEFEKPDTIVMPKTGEKSKSPGDLVDGLLFETCNAEVNPEYDLLSNEFNTKRRSDDPMTAMEYGRKKAEVEAKATLKQAQLLADARKNGVVLSNQGNRNLLAMLKSYRQSKGEELADYETLRDDPERLEAAITENLNELAEFLESVDSDTSGLKESLFETIATSRHKPQSEEFPDGTRFALTTAKLYAYEQLEAITKGAFTGLIEKDIKKAGNDTQVNIKDVKNFLNQRLAPFEGDKAKMMARSRVVNELKKLFPALASQDFPSIGITTDMTEVANAEASTWRENDRFEDEDHPLRKAAEKARDELQKALSQARVTVSQTTFPDFHDIYHGAVTTLVTKMELVSREVRKLSVSTSGDISTRLALFDLVMADLAKYIPTEI